MKFLGLLVRCELAFVDFIGMYVDKQRIEIQIRCLAAVDQDVAGFRMPVALVTFRRPEVDLALQQEALMLILR